MLGTSARPNTMDSKIQESLRMTSSRDPAPSMFGPAATVRGESLSSSGDRLDTMAHVKQSQRLSSAQPEEILAYGIAEAQRHLAPLAEQKPPQAPRQPKIVRVERPVEAMLIQSKPSVKRKSFGASVVDLRVAVVQMAGLYWAQFSHFANKLWWKTIRRRCPDWGCHRPLIRALLRPYLFPGWTCPQDHHFYPDYSQLAPRVENDDE